MTLINFGIFHDPLRCALDQISFPSFPEIKRKCADEFHLVGSLRTGNYIFLRMVVLRRFSSAVFRFSFG